MSPAELLSYGGSSRKVDIQCQLVELFFSLQVWGEVSLYVGCLRQRPV